MLGPNVEVTGHKLTAGFDSRGGLRSEATTGARRTKLAVNLWSGAETRYAFIPSRFLQLNL
jgi:hypothetical protein